jgi:hypothetical protein
VQRRDRAVCEHTERAGPGAADDDPAPAVDGEAEDEAGRARCFLPRACVEVDAVELTVLAARPKDAGRRIPRDPFRVVEPVDEDLSRGRDRRLR